ncbi:hypothetical protein KJ853_04255, partial [Patescibacteria group bacterium]|nr:hypothetical protein [Patescibacteria group bacterium]
RANKMQLKLETKNQALAKLFDSWEKFIGKETLAKKFEPGKREVKFDLGKELVVEGEKIKAAIKKIL